jgi:hypothetical protein
MASMALVVGANVLAITAGMTTLSRVGGPFLMMFLLCVSAFQGVLSIHGAWPWSWAMALELLLYPVNATVGIWETALWPEGWRIVHALLYPLPWLGIAAWNVRAMSRRPAAARAAGYSSEPPAAAARVVAMVAAVRPPSNPLGWARLPSETRLALTSMLEELSPAEVVEEMIATQLIGARSAVVFDCLLRPEQITVPWMRAVCWAGEMGYLTAAQQTYLAEQIFDAADLRGNQLFSTPRKGFLRAHSEFPDEWKRRIALGRSEWATFTALPAVLPPAQWEYDHDLVEIPRRRFELMIADRDQGRVSSFVDSWGRYYRSDAPVQGLFVALKHLRQEGRLSDGECIHLLHTVLGWGQEELCRAHPELRALYRAGWPDGEGSAPDETESTEEDFIATESRYQWWDGFLAIAAEEFRACGLDWAAEEAESGDWAERVEAGEAEWNRGFGARALG